MAGRMLATFRWLGRLPTDEEVGADPATRYSEDFGYQWQYQATLPVVTAVWEAFQKLGHKTDSQPPYFSNHGWYFGLELDGKRFSILVQWIPKRQRTENDYFAAQPFSHSGLSFFISDWQPAAKLRKASVVLEQTLIGCPLVADFAWVDEDQF